jgi:hypothetical protein
VFQLKREYKSIEVMNSPQTQIRQDSKVCNRLRMSNPKDTRTPGNTTAKLFQLMMGCESIEVMNNPQMHIRRDAKLYIPIRIPSWKDWCKL